MSLTKAIAPTKQLPIQQLRLDDSSLLSKLFITVLNNFGEIRLPHKTSDFTLNDSDNLSC